MRYVYRIVSFFALFVLFTGCGNEKNNEKKIESKAYSSSSKSCFVDTRSIFKNINAPVFANTGAEAINVYEGRLDVLTLNATAKNGGTITYEICGRGSNNFAVHRTNGKVWFKIPPVFATIDKYKFIAIATDSNDNKRTSQVFTVNILESAPPIIGDVGNKTFIVDSQITRVEIKNTGGAITKFSISPALPSDLTLFCSQDECAIFGTPSAVTTAITVDLETGKAISNYIEHNITVSNSDVENNATINIRVVNPEAPVLTEITSVVYDGVGVGQLYKKDTLAESWFFTNSGGAIKSCTLAPAVAGLAIDSTSCTITGIPTSRQGSRYHNVTATNAGGEFTVAVIIQVQ